MPRLSFRTLLLSALLAGHAAGATTVAGGSVTLDETWQAALSPYVVQGDIVIEPGATLTIEAGVDVQLAEQDALAAGTDPKRIEFVVHGALHAAGKAAAPIRFHPETDDFANSWYGLVVPADAERVQLARVELSGANIGLSSSAPAGVVQLSHATLSHNFTAILLKAGQLELSHLVLADNAVSGLELEAGSAAVAFTLTNSVLRLNGSHGLLATVAAGGSIDGRVSNSTIYGNTSSGVTARATGQGAQLALELQNSIVVANGILGVYSAAAADGVASVTTTYSDVYGNGIDFMDAEAGNGCIANDPGFVDAPNDLRLRTGSDCIDSASAEGAPAVDLLDRQRPQGAGVDMGAYEHSAGDDPVEDSAAGGVGGAGGVDTAGGFSGAFAGSEALAGARANDANAGQAGLSRANPGQGGANDAASMSAPPTVTPSGCGCRLGAGQAPAAVALAWPAWLALLLAARRRRR